MQKKGLLAILVALGCLGPWVFPSSVKTVNIVEMVDASGFIFVGRCVDIQEFESNIGLPGLEYTFEVQESLRGTEPRGVLKFRQIGGAGGLRVAGLPQYRRGEELLLFLHPESELGLTSPVGMSQGVFHILRGEREPARAVNGLGNSNLFYDLPSADLESMGVSQRDAAKVKNGNSFQVLLDVVRQVERERRTRKTQ